MVIFMVIPLQAGVGLIFGIVYVLVIGSILYHLFNISRNTDQIAADMERVADQLEDSERREDEEP